MRGLSNPMGQSNEGRHVGEGAQEVEGRMEATGGGDNLGGTEEECQREARRSPVSLSVGLHCLSPVSLFVGGCAA